MVNILRSKDILPCHGVVPHAGWRRAHPVILSKDLVAAMLREAFRDLIDFSSLQLTAHNLRSLGSRISDLGSRISDHLPLVTSFAF